VKTPDPIEWDEAAAKLGPQTVADQAAEDDAAGGLTAH
jgi:hypothetical protein